MRNKWYWAFKNIFFGPALRVWNRPWTEGMDNIPAEGPAILVSNHQAVMDSFFFPLMCPRQITFLAKSEYFTTPGVVGRAQAWFFSSVGQVPVERDSDAAGDAMLKAAKKILDRETSLVSIQKVPALQMSASIKAVPAWPESPWPPASPSSQSP